MTPRYVLILERGSPKPVAEIGRLLSYHLELHPTDSIARVRYGGGLLAEGLDSELADALCERLRGIGVLAKKVESGRWAIAPRGFRAFTLDFLERELRVGLVGGRTLAIPWEGVRGFHLYALQQPVDPRERGAKSEPAAPVPLDEPEELLSGAEDSTGNLPHGETRAAALSPRARRLAESVAELEGGAVEFYVTLYCTEPVGPVRIRRNDFDFRCLGGDRLDHSLDNLLVLLEKILHHVPGEKNRQAAERFVAAPDVKDVLYFKEEEAKNVDLWNLHWIQLETEESLEIADEDQERAQP